MGEKSRTRSRAWALEQIDKQHPGFHPLIEMVEIAQKPRYRAHDKARFGFLTEICKYVVPRPRPLEIITDEDGNPVGSGEITISWKQ